MAIERGLPGYGNFITGLAQQAGQAVAAREQIQRQFERDTRMEEIATQIQARREDMRMAQEFERRAKALDLELELAKYARSKEWEIEKMEIRSRLDFENEEKSRLTRKAEFQQKISSLNKAVDDGKISRDQADQQIQALELLELGAETAAAQALRPKTMDQILGEELRRKASMAQSAAPTPASVARFQVDQFDTGPVIRDKGTNVVEAIQPNQEYVVLNPMNGQKQLVSGKLLEATNPETGNPWYMDVVIQDKGSVKPTPEQSAEVQEKLLEMKKIESQERPRVLIGGYGSYYPDQKVKPKSKRPKYDPGARVRSGLSQTGKALSREP